MFQENFVPWDVRENILKFREILLSLENPAETRETKELGELNSRIYQSTQICDGRQSNIRLIQYCRKILHRYRYEMELQLFLEGMTTSLVSPSFCPRTRTSKLMWTEGRSSDSEIGVIACFRHHPIIQQKLVTGRTMTTDFSGCTDDDLPEFSWS